jgi:hypothetical protein
MAVQATMPSDIDLDADKRWLGHHRSRGGQRERQTSSLSRRRTERVRVNGTGEHWFAIRTTVSLNFGGDYADGAMIIPTGAVGEITLVDLTSTSTVKRIRTESERTSPTCW